MTVGYVTRTAPLLPAGSVAAAAASAALRAVSAAVAGFALTSGLALVLWAVTPSAPADVADATDAIRGGAVAFAAAHFLPVSVSGTALTLRPLLATCLVIATIATAAGRGQSVRGRALEALHASVFVVLYAVAVDVLVAVAAPSDAAQPGLGAPLALAALTAVGSLIAHPTAWRAWWVATVPPYLTVAARAAYVAVMALLCASAVTLAVGMAVSFPEAAHIAELTIHSFGDALGMALVCLAFLPNAILAALGYLSGAGFTMGAASFSPLDVHSADLPAIPLLAAVPSGVPTPVAWIVFVGPVAAGLIATWVLRGVGASRWQRIAAVVVTAAAAGLACALLALAGGGGIAGGPWTSMGAPPWITGGLLAGVILLIAGSVTLAAGWGALPWRAGGAAGRSRGRELRRREQRAVRGDDHDARHVGDGKAAPADEPAIIDDAEVPPEGDGAEEAGAVMDDAGEGVSPDSMTATAELGTVAEEAGDVSDSADDATDATLGSAGQEDAGAVIDDYPHGSGHPERR